MAGGILAVPLGVFEADQVGKTFVAEEQGQAGGAFQTPGFVGSPAVGGAAVAERGAQHPFAAGDPAAALLRQLLDEGRRYRPFRRPHADGGGAEAAGMAGARRLDLLSHARTSARIACSEGQRRIRLGFARDLEVEQQRSQRMGLRRAGDFDLPALGQCPVARDELAQLLADQGQQAQPVGAGISLALAHQFGQHRLAAACGFAGPCQVIPGDQVGEIGIGEVSQRRFALVCQIAIQVEQALVAGERHEHGGVIAAKAGLQQKIPLGGA